MPDRVHGVGVLGGVAPTRGSDAIGGGLDRSSAVRLAPLLALARVPLGVALTRGDPGDPAAGRPGARPLRRRPAARATRTLLARPEFKAMFLDDLLNGSRFQIVRAAQRPGPLHPRLGLRRGRRDGAGALVARRRRPHRPLRRTAATSWRRLPDATLTMIAGESHLGGLGVAEEVLADADGARPARARGRTASPGRRTRASAERRIRVQLASPPWVTMAHNYTRVTRASMSPRDRWGRRISRRRRRRSR